MKRARALQPGRQGKPLLRWLAAAGVLLFAGATHAALGDALAAELSYPTSGATITDPTRPFGWTPVASAQSYLLVIGTSSGQSDLWMSGETGGTSVVVLRDLPKGPRLYARLWTRSNGILRHSLDVPFTVAAATTTTTTGHAKVAGFPPFSPVSRAAMAPMTSTASMVHPAQGDSDVNFWQPFAWTSVVGAQGYRLLVGSSPGLGDVSDSGETTWTSLWIPLLPAGNYYGRIATKIAGRWASNDFVFGSSGYPAATIGLPAYGSVLDTGGTLFSWESVPNATAYRVVIGTVYGASNVADSGSITANSFEVFQIPRVGPVFVRLFTNKWGDWRSTDAIFSTGQPVLPTLVAPVDGSNVVNTGMPFEWTPTIFASSYRLEIGSAPGESDLHNSGELAVSKRFVGPLPLGKMLYGRVSARVGDLWAPLDFRFVVGANGSSVANVIPAAFWATDFVRGMADDANVPVPGTPLATLLAAEGYTSAFCNDYATVLLSMLEQMNVTQPARPLNVCLKPNGYDCHTLVEFQEPVGDVWMLLDPTFDLTVVRSADGKWATASDVSQATRTMRFSDVSYQAVGARGNAVAKSYYLDYPLLYLNVYPDGAPLDPWSAASSLPYIESVALPLAAPGLYAVHGTPGDQMQLSLDGAAITVPCDPIDGLSYVFWASSIEAAPGITVYRPRRFVF